MNSTFVKQLLKYSLSLLVAVGVLWYVLRDVELAEMLERLDDLNYFWIGLSVFFGLFSYILRAYRWNLLLAPSNYRPSLGSTFLAVMTGYLANMLLPRFGEIARCGVLKRSDQVPVSTSLGTVVVERVFDLVLLLFIVGLTLILEFDRLQDFLAGVFSGGNPGERKSSAVLYLAAGLLIAVLLAVWFLRRNFHWIREHRLYKKATTFLGELLAGVLSVRKLEKPGMFVLSTLLIWLMYYLMSYVIVFSLPQTADINLIAGLAILAMGGIGMAAPVQGGLGTYHLLVSGVLMVYGAPKNEAVLLAFVLHTSQTVFVVVAGVISLVVSALRTNKKTVSPVKHV